MAPKRVSGPSDPPPVNLCVKATIRHTFEVGLTSTSLTGVTAATLGSSLPGASGWNSFRILKVSVYNPNATIATTASPFVALEMPGDTAFLDGNSQTFQDHGMVGAYCPAIHVIPAFVQRERWYAVAATDIIFNVAGSPYASTTGTILCHVTVELQSTLQTPAFLISSSSSTQSSDALSGTPGAPSKDDCAHSPYKAGPSTTVPERIRQLEGKVQRLSISAPKTQPECRL